jgi:poly(A) polymerase/tRNA nucleotidyltransferase (CCA-adding enzyme)
MNTQVTIPVPAVFILLTLSEAGFEAYVVGGAVRDILRQTPVVDWDFTTNALPDQIQQLFAESFYENEFGTVGISFQHLTEQMGLAEASWLTDLGAKPKSDQSDKIINPSDATKLHPSLSNPAAAEDQPKRDAQLGQVFPPFEVTTYRSEGLYSDFRRPDQVEWGQTIDEDLKRRDFTVNAIALQIPLDILKHKLAQAIEAQQPMVTFSASEFELTDTFAGLQDLDNHLIKTVGDPDERFQEDALRMLRAIRFSVQLNMQIDPATYDSIQRNSALLEKISWERIRDEFIKILKTDYPAEGIELLDQVGMLQLILPELLDGKGVEQGGHHTTDVWTHSLEALRECPSPDPIVRLATLIHDIGKPATVGDNNGQITFYSHEIVGARTAKAIARRLKLSKHDLDKLFILVRYHMFYYQPHNSDAAIRRFMRKVGLTNVDDILDLREADRLGSGAKKTSWRLEEMKQRMIEQLHQPMDSSDLAINGNDLMEHFQLKPGPQLGQVLTSLLEKVLDNPELNTKEGLLQQAQQLLSQPSKEA